MRWWSFPGRLIAGSSSPTDTWPGCSRSPTSREHSKSAGGLPRVLGDRRRATHQNARNDRASRAAWTRNAGPGFELPSTPDQTLSLSELRGHPVILVFYPEDWSPVCSDQLALYQQLLPEFQRFGAALVGAPLTVWCHLAFAQDRNLHFPL